MAASWNVLTAITAGNSAFSEGSTPTENNATYDRRSAVYKELGKTKSISDRMLAAGASFIDQEAEQTEVAIREVINSIKIYAKNCKSLRKRILLRKVTRLLQPPGLIYA